MSPKRTPSRPAARSRHEVEFPLAESGRESVIEFDPQASAESQRERSVSMMAAPAPGHIEIPQDYFDARDELLSRLGGKASMTSVRAASVAISERMGLENILGVGIGVKESAGSITGELAVKVFVQEKVSARRVATDAEIPETISGIPTDVEETGQLTSFSYARKFDRPVPCGTSCGQTDVTAGTIGALVVLRNNRLALLSNNHVLANENAASIGAEIIQPGRSDRGSAATDVIAALEAFIPINLNGTNLIDAAVAWTSSKLVSAQHITYVLNPTPSEAAVLTTVLKNGRTTQATAGWISAVHVNGVGVQYSGGVATFDDQIIVRSLNEKPFSQPGDSGALIVNSGTKQPVGLLFAGSASHTVANPIGTVMEKLNIDRFVGS